ncbi:hypothetical protein DL771_006165 [Monosporascus sp. 5C6A]|nr:hypothetical protein DL771_006165 [Monosporascus sp. 5C6A]
MLRRNRRKQKIGEDDEDDEPEGDDGLRTEFNRVGYLMRVGVGGQEFLMGQAAICGWHARTSGASNRSSAGPLQSVCAFGPPFPGGFLGGATGNQVEVHIWYLSGDFLNGAMGFADVAVVNVTVPGQQISLLAMFRDESRSYIAFGAAPPVKTREYVHGTYSEVNPGYRGGLRMLWHRSRRDPLERAPGLHHHLLPVHQNDDSGDGPA